MNVRARFPAGPPTGAVPLVEAVTTAPPDGPLVVGDERMLDFLVAFGRRLLAPPVARRFPELGSLGFFLRRGELRRNLAGLADPPEVLRFPRGLLFHVPPANVDTIFVYSWALSAVAGNPNIVRISTRSAGAADLVLELLNETVVDAHPAVGATQRMVSYDRDDATTAALSLACDLRVLWGGDSSVTQLRRFPLQPWARDLTFPDRSSFTVLAAQGWSDADPDARRRVAEGLYNDVYWFDQAACSSPRALFWVGDEASVAAARVELTDALAAVVEHRRPVIDAAMAVQKRVATYGLAADGAAERLRFRGNEIAEVDLAAAADVPREWLGSGTLVQARVDRLEDLVPLVVRRDQTICHFGFAEETLTAFARALAGRGVDRLVPVGQALAFAPVWDGYDLVREFTRLTTVALR